MSTKPDQILLIEPQNELQFKGPFDKAVICVMKLTNPTNHHVFFKIKTTAPKMYCVRPSLGSVAANSKTDVTISLQAFNYDSKVKYKHKFLVQSLIGSENEQSTEQIWQSNPEEMMETKLKCSLIIPGVTDIGDGGDDGQDEKNDTFGDKKDGDKENPGGESMAKAIGEVAKLAEESARLRAENSMLRTEAARLRAAVGAEGGGLVTQSQEGRIPIWAAAVIVAVLGVLIGKFLM